MRQLPLGVRLRDRAEFASFLPGANAEAVRHLGAIAAGEQGGLVWLHGPEGAGKTHLLQAVCAHASRHRQAAYLPLRALEPLDATALEGWHGLACVCLDDVDALAGRPDQERALFNLYRDVEERGAALVIAARTAPTDLPWGLADLRSRLAAGLVLRLTELDEAGRLEALRLRAGLRGVELPDETLRFLQRRVPRDLRSLYRVLDTLDDAALAAQRRLTVPFVRGVLEAQGGGA